MPIETRAFFNVINILYIHRSRMKSAFCQYFKQPSFYKASMPKRPIQTTQLAVRTSNRSNAVVGHG